MRDRKRSRRAVKSWVAHQQSSTRCLRVDDRHVDRAPGLIALNRNASAATPRVANFLTLKLAGGSLNKSEITQSSQFHSEYGGSLARHSEYNYELNIIEILT